MKFKDAVNYMKPRAVFCVILAAAFAVSVFFFTKSVNTFVISCGGENKTVRTLSSDVESALASAGIDGEVYTVDSSAEVDGKIFVSMVKTFPVSIAVGNQVLNVSACEKDTVASVLALAGLTVDEYDMISPALGSTVREGACIDYVNVDYVTGSYTQPIPYMVETVFNRDIDSGIKRTTSAGVDGVEQINYTEKLVNGEVVETHVDSRITLLAAKNAVQTVGTRNAAVLTSSEVYTISELMPESPIELDADGKPVYYKKHVTVQATAYTHTGHNCSTGVAPRPGYIAVNPKVIPYGTKMYIVSSDGKFNYGYAIAADTGGFIYTHPTNVDLFFDTLAGTYSFGRRNVEIYILE